MNIEQITYSLLRFNFHFQNLDKELQRLGSFLETHGVAVRSLVDVGCGDGAITIRLQQLLGVERAHGIDVNAALLSRARERGVVTWCGDAASLVVQEKFDLAVSYGSLHHFEHIQVLIESMRRLAKQYLLIVDNTIRERYWFHRVTGSPHSPVESSPYGIRTVAEIMRALRHCHCTVMGNVTIPNANVWHDRSFFLAAV